MKGKFKKLKESLRWWNRKIFGWVYLKVEDPMMELNELDNVISKRNNDLTSLLEDKRRKNYNLVWINLERNESILRQKSRQT